MFAVTSKIRFAVVCVATVAVAMFVMVSTSRAEVASYYSGYAYSQVGMKLANPASPVPDYVADPIRNWYFFENQQYIWYKSSTELPAGVAFRVYPSGGGWHFALRGNQWYYIPSRNLNEWSCTPANNIVFRLNRSANVHQFNSNTSRVQYVAPPGAAFSVDCMNGFSDAAKITNPNIATCAAIGCGPDRYVLVQVEQRPACLYTNPRCMIAEPVGGFPKARGYIKLTELEFMEKVPQR